MFSWRMSSATAQLAQESGGKGRECGYPQPTGLLGTPAAKGAAGHQGPLCSAPRRRVAPGGTRTGCCVRGEMWYWERHGELHEVPAAVFSTAFRGFFFPPRCFSRFRRAPQRAQGRCPVLVVRPAALLIGNLEMRGSY